MRIRWTATALFQITAICDYWTENNKSQSYAARIVSETQEALKAARKNPKAHPLFANTKYRRIAMANFSVFYSETHDEILVNAFWDNRQSPKKLRKLLEVHRGKK